MPRSPRSMSCWQPGHGMAVTRGVTDPLRHPGEEMEPGGEQRGQSTEMSVRNIESQPRDTHFPVLPEALFYYVKNNVLWFLISQLTAFKMFQHSLKTNRFVLKRKFTNLTLQIEPQHVSLCALFPQWQLHNWGMAVLGQYTQQLSGGKKVHKERPSRVLEQVKEWGLAGKSASLELIHSLNKKCISFNTYYMKEEYFKCSQWSGQRK